MYRSEDTCTRAPRFRIFVASAQRFGCSVPQKLAGDIIGVVDWGEDVGDSKSNSTKKVRKMLRH